MVTGLVCGRPVTASPPGLAALHARLVSAPLSMSSASRAVSAGYPQISACLSVCVYVCLCVCVAMSMCVLRVYGMLLCVSVCV